MTGKPFINKDILDPLDPASFGDAVVEGVQAYSDAMIGAIGPLPGIDRALVYVAARAIAEAIREDMDSVDKVFLTLIEEIVGVDAKVIRKGRKEGSSDEQDS